MTEFEAVGDDVALVVVVDGHVYSLCGLSPMARCAAHFWGNAPGIGREPTP
jgi:hypothetical protein